jgi:hypothetical protein
MAAVALKVVLNSSADPAVAAAVFTLQGCPVGMLRTINLRGLASKVVESSADAQGGKQVELSPGAELARQTVKQCHDTV